MTDFTFAAEPSNLHAHKSRDHVIHLPDNEVLLNVDTGLSETDMPSLWRFNKACKATASRMLGITYRADWLVSYERACCNANYFEDTIL